MKVRKNILIIHSPLAKGRAEVLLVNLGKEFIKRGYKITFLNLVAAPELIHKFEIKDIKEGLIKSQDICKKDFHFVPQKKDYLKILFNILPYLFFNKKIKSLYKINEVIWAHAFPASIVAALLSIIYGKKDKKLIYTHHFLKNEEKGFLQRIYVYFLNRFDYVVGVGRATSESLKKCFPQLDNKIVTISNGIVLDRFLIVEDKNDLRKQLGLPINSILAICIGRFTPLKNQNFLIKVLKKFTNIKIITIGEGSELDNFLKKIEECNLSDNLIHLGFVPNEKIPFYLKASDIFLFPSKGEGFSVAIIEALASGLPVCIFKEIYSPELNGGVLIANDENEFLELVGELINNEKMRLQQKEKALKVVKNFDIKKTVESYEQLFNS
jgi:glycosyltransferase involved in cell wall biosynthesis